MTQCYIYYVYLTIVLGSVANNLFFKSSNYSPKSLGLNQRYTYRVLQTIQMKLILLCVWAEQAILGSAKTALKFKYEILICRLTQIQFNVFGRV